MSERRCIPHAIPRGFLKLIFLQMLCKTPMHGYELMDEIEKKTDGAWRPKPGSVYPALKWLLERDLIRLRKQGGKGPHVYEATEKGRMYLEERIQGIQQTFKERQFKMVRLGFDLFFPGKTFAEARFELIKRAMEQFPDLFKSKDWFALSRDKQISLLKNHGKLLEAHLKMIREKLAELGNSTD
jgi:DNA-binding PadR family transcriptional regulator